MDHNNAVQRYTYTEKCTSGSHLYSERTKMGTSVYFCLIFSSNGEIGDSGFFISTLKETSKNKVGGRSCCFNDICLQNIAAELSTSARKKSLNSVNNSEKICQMHYLNFQCEIWPIWVWQGKKFLRYNDQDLSSWRNIGNNKG